MTASEIEQYRRELADHDARERAAHHSRSPWRIALDELLLANYGNDAFWLHDIPDVMHVTDDEVRLIRAWFAGKCRICERPMHVTDVRRERCRRCEASNPPPVIIESAIVAGHEVEAAAS